MANILILIIFLALIHFIYEGIILPSLRLAFRYRLFKYRDELRSLKYENREELSNDVYVALQGYINNAIKILPQFDVITTYKARILIEKDKRLIEFIKQQNSLIDNTSIGEIKNIRDKTIRVCAYAFFANTAMLIMYLLPIFILAALVDYIKSNFKNWMKRIVNELVSVPENQIDRIIPFQSA